MSDKQWAEQLKNNVLQENSLNQDLAAVGQYDRSLTNTYWQELIPAVTINAYLPQKLFNLVTFTVQDEQILPEYEPNVYYIKNENDDYDLIFSSEPPADWGTGEFYLRENVPDTSFFGFIMNNCDFLKSTIIQGEYPDEQVIPIEIDEEENKTYNYWNPSINELYALFDEKFNNDEDFGNQNIKQLFNSIDNSDAAVKFIYLNENDDLFEYVKPFTNLSDEIYPSQRGGGLDSSNPNKGWDQTHHGLDNIWDWENVEPQDDSRANNLQFTSRQPSVEIVNQTIHRWLRLIMPKYSRHVEIEDLNRNFWVIGNVLDKLLDYLFGDVNPYVDLIQKILNELAQLWENILHLWLDFAIINQKEKYDDIHAEFIPLPTDSLRPYVKFDNIDNFSKSTEKSLKQLINYILLGFEENDIEQKQNYYEEVKNRLENEYVIDDTTYEPAHKTIIKRLKFLESKYSNQRLCIIPFIRLNNYEGNAFQTIFIPGVYWYDYTRDNNSESRWSATTLLYYDSWEQEELQSTKKPLIIDIEGRYGSRPYLEYLYAIKELDGGQCMIGSPFYGFDPSEDSFYYGALRFVPTINLNEETQDITFELSLQDVGCYSFKKECKELSKFVFNNNININQSMTIGQYEDGAKPDIEIQSEQFEQQKSGFYLGELLSSHEKISAPIENDVDVSILKIGDFLPLEMTLGNDILIPFHGAAKLISKQSEFNNMGVVLKSANSNNVIYPVKKGIVFQRRAGQGYLSSLNNYICIESESDNNEKIYYFYGNLNPVFYPISEGVTVTEDTPIGIVNDRTCYFCIATYDEDNNMFQFINIESNAKIPNYYGTYAKDDYSFIPNNYVESEGKSEPQSFDTLTYGIGSYRFNENTGVAQYRRAYVNKILNSSIIPNTNDPSSDYIRGHNVNGAEYISEGMLKFVRYKLKELTNENDEVYYNANKTDFSSYKVDEITMSDLETWGIEYAKQQIKLRGKEDINQLFVTKIGINYWTGALMNNNEILGAAPQWNYGMTCHLLHYDAETGDVISLGQLPLFDGYWTQNITVFEPDGGTQWRRMGFRARVKKITRKQKGKRVTEYKVTDAYLIWYDHNVAQDISGTSDRERVRIPIVLEIDQDGIKKFVRDESRSVIIDSQISYTGSGEWNEYSTPVEMATAALRTVDTSNNSPFIVANHFVRVTGNRQSLRQPEYEYNKGIIKLNEVSGNIPNPIEKLGSGGGTESYEYSYDRDKSEADTSEGYWNAHAKWDIDY